MKRLLLSAVVLFTLAATMQSASAAEVCPPGRMTQSCLKHMELLKNLGARLYHCFVALEAEYHGDTGNGAGKGQNYIIKRNECAQLASDALDDITDAYVPGGDTSPRRALEQAVDNWTVAK
ncbi:MAG: hypothetical protein QM488_17835 [Rhizobiaceae bacterium]